MAEIYTSEEKELVDAYRRGFNDGLLTATEVVQDRLKFHPSDDIKTKCILEAFTEVFEAYKR